MNIGNELRWILVACGAILLFAIYWWGRRGNARERAVPQRNEAQFTSFASDAEEAPAEDRSAHEEDFNETITVDEVSWSPPTSAADFPQVHLHEEQESRGRREPTVSDEFDAEPAEDFAVTPMADMPTLSNEVPPQPSKPAVARETRSAGSPAAQRKIIALRLAAPSNGLQGEQLLSLLNGAKLQHGKFGIFHRLEANASVFSVASMVEPGSFDLATMEQSQYPGVTLFMLLPGPLDGLIAFDQMLNFGRRLEQATGGVLQDERARPLTLQALTRMREEVLDFQHLVGSLGEITH